jgi:hypothetical protein
MTRPTKTDQEVGYLRDLWTEVKTMEAEYNGMFSMVVRPAGRPGVMVYRMIFTPLTEGIENGMGVSALEFVYPNVEQSTYAGFMWRKAIALSRQVEEGLPKLRPQRKKGTAAR